MSDFKVKLTDTQFTGPVLKRGLTLEQIIPFEVLHILGGLAPSEVEQLHLILSKRFKDSNLKHLSATALVGEVITIVNNLAVGYFDPFILFKGHGDARRT
jgi:hypothetical protein